MLKGGEHVEVRVQRHIVTQWRDGAVFRTRYDKDVWVGLHERHTPPKGVIYTPMPDNYAHRTIRVVRND